MQGIKHLVECHCTLTIYKGKDQTIYHKFPVYSKFSDNGKIIPKLAKCNNCDTVHYVYEICKSEIRPGKDDTDVIVTKKDLSLMMPIRIVNIFNEYDTDIATWEQVLDVIEQDALPLEIVIKRDVINEEQQVKILKIESTQKFKIFTEIIRSLV